MDGRIHNHVDNIRKLLLFLEMKEILGRYRSKGKIELTFYGLHRRPTREFFLAPLYLTSRNVNFHEFSISFHLLELSLYLNIQLLEVFKYSLNNFIQKF